MKRKLKICFRIFLVIIVTAACIVAGFHTRHTKAIVVTQFGQTSIGSKAGYLLESEGNKLIMIDGGSSEASDHVLDAIKQKGGVVEAWFITLPHKDHAEVLLEALKDNEIQIGGIYVSFNGREWYEASESEEEAQFAIGLIETLEGENIRGRVHELQLRDEINIDNLNFKILKTKNPEYTENTGNNQSMIIKVSNNFKSMIFLSELGTEYQEDFVNDNQDEIEADSVQVSYHGENTANEEIYKAIKPKISFWNVDEAQNIEGCKDTYMSKNGDVTVEIW